MAKSKEKAAPEAAEQILRIYEAGYQISPVTKEEDVEKVVSGIRSVLEKAGGSFISEGAPALTRLAYGIPGMEGGKSVLFDRAFFGWLKFESSVEAARELENYLKTDASILRAIVFRTVRQDTRAKFKAPTLRDVKRGDAIKTIRKEENAAPVSEADLDKALETITAE